MLVARLRGIMLTVAFERRWRIVIYDDNNDDSFDTDDDYEDDDKDN